MLRMDDLKKQSIKHTPILPCIMALKKGSLTHRPRRDAGSVCQGDDAESQGRQCLSFY